MAHRFRRRLPVVYATEQPGEAGADDERGEGDHHRNLRRDTDLRMCKYKLFNIKKKDLSNMK